MKIGKYRHYKGMLYEVIGVAKHSESLEDLVVYKALYSSKSFGNAALWVRPIKMFNEMVMISKDVKVPRFKFEES